MKFSLFIVLFLCVEAYKLPKVSRDPPFIEDNDRIIGGHETLPNAYPFMVRLTVIWRNGDGSLCGGSLISNQWVLTAGHCVYNIEKQMLWERVIVNLGDHNVDFIDPMEQEIEASEVIIHNNFVYYGANDIAVIKLSSPPSLSYAIQPGCLTPSGKEYDGQLGMAIGWGLTSTVAQDSSHVLKETFLPIISASECPADGFKNDEMICTGFVNEVGTDTIFSGDSGGPLFITDNQGKRTIIGAASFVILQGEYPPQVVLAGVFTKVASHLSWIQRNVDESLCINN